MGRIVRAGADRSGLVCRGWVDLGWVVGVGRGWVGLSELGWIGRVCRGWAGAARLGPSGLGRHGWGRAVG